MAFTYSSAAGQVITYIDGVPGTPIAVVGAIGDITPAQNDVWIGEREIAPHAFDGEMDELRVWNVARTAEEIANTYTKSLTPAEAQSVPGLVGYWTFDDGSADDLTLNENDGTFVNQAGAVGSPQTFGANVAPVADPGLSATVFTNEVGDVVITGTDADGDLLSFATTDGASGSFGASLTVSDADTTDNLATVQYGATASLGADTLSFTVSDGIATSAAELVNVTAADPTNRALAVDGSLDYVNAGAAASLAVTDTFTLEAWIYPTGPGSGPNTAPSATTGGGLSGGGDRRSRRRIPASPLRRRHDPVRARHGIASIYVGGHWLCRAPGHLDASGSGVRLPPVDGGHIRQWRARVIRRELGYHRRLRNDLRRGMDRRPPRHRARRNRWHC